MQAVKDITTGQPTSTLEENQMYDWDGQFDDTLGLPIQLRNRVSDPGTPPVRASPRASGYGGGAGGATVNIGSGPGLYTVTKDKKGKGMGEAEELPPQQREDRTVPKIGLCPPHCSPDHGKPKLLRVQLAGQVRRRYAARLTLSLVEKDQG